MRAQPALHDSAPGRDRRPVHRAGTGTRTSAGSGTSTRQVHHVRSPHFISSKTRSGFLICRCPGLPDYPNHRQISPTHPARTPTGSIWQPHPVRHRRRPCGARSGRIWQLELTDGRRVRARYLVCANGVTGNPTSSHGLAVSTARSSSVTYRDASEFAGKRVFVVGAGNSGVDIACDAAFAWTRRSSACGAGTTSSRSTSSALRRTSSPIATQTASLA